MAGLLLIVLAYLFGSIPFGVILARYHGDKDITKEGSGNIGATNVARVIGKRAGAITLALDAAKGIIPLIICVVVSGRVPWLVSVIALAVFLGHLYPIFNYFKGGKGVATALGIFIFISPLSALCALIIFSVVVYIWRYVSLGSVIAAGSMPALMGLFATSKFYILLSLIMGGLVIYRHKDNIRRLLEGTENRVGEKRDVTMEEELEEDLD